MTRPREGAGFSLYRGYSVSSCRSTGKSPSFTQLREPCRPNTVTVFGRHGSRNWTKLGEFPIDRQLLTE